MVLHHPRSTQGERTGVVCLPLLLNRRVVFAACVPDPHDEDEEQSASQA